MASAPATDIAPVALLAAKSNNSPEPDRHSFSDSEKDIGTPSTLSEADLHAKWYEPPDNYESKHRWDPKATWSPEEQRKLTRRLDVRVALVACVCFSALQLDRGNIGNALSDNMLDDIGINTGDYNIGMTIFYVCFLAAELPSQIISKKLGSDVWIPIQMMSWSAVAIGQAGIQGKSGFFATRALLGLIEGGFIADTILYLSYYYTSAELTIRLAYFWVSLTITTILGAFLAAGILEMRHHTHMAGWRWLFAIEGALTFLVGVFAFFYLPPSPTQTDRSVWGRIRKKSWFTEREETIIVNKVLRDDPTKSSMHNRQGLSLKDLWKALTDYDMWPLYIIGITHYIAQSTVGAYFTLTLRSLGYTTFQTNLLTIPSSVLTAIGNLGLAYLSKKLKERLGVASISAWWELVLFIALVSIPDSTSKWAKWALLTLIVGTPYSHPIMVSLNSMNAGSVRTRTVASAVYNMFVQSAALIASNVYQPNDKPYYHKGNRVLLGIIALSLVNFAFAKGWYIWRNRSRDKIWNKWTLEQKDEYIRTTKDQGNKRLDFRFLH